MGQWRSQSLAHAFAALDTGPFGHVADGRQLCCGVSSMKNAACGVWRLCVLCERFNTNFALTRKNIPNDTPVLPDNTFYWRVFVRRLRVGKHNARRWGTLGWFIVLHLSSANETKQRRRKKKEDKKTQQQPKPQSTAPLNIRTRAPLRFRNIWRRPTRPAIRSPFSANESIRGSTRI